MSLQLPHDINDSSTGGGGLSVQQERLGEEELLIRQEQRAEGIGGEEGIRRSIEKTKNEK